MADLPAMEARQGARRLRLSFSQNNGPQARLIVNRFGGAEYMSPDFAFKVEFPSDDVAIEPEAMHVEASRSRPTQPFL